MLNFLSFGSGSSGNCYYLFTEQDGLIIDIGIGLRQLKKYFQDYGLDMGGVKHVLVTHDHADHVKSVGTFSQEHHLPVYATEMVHKGIDLNECVHKKIMPIDRHIVEKGRTFQLGDFTITAFEVPHDSHDNVGYCIDAEGVRFCLMTDVGHVTEEMKGYIGSADYLVIEANHDKEMLRNGNYPQFLKERVASDSGHLSNVDCATAIAENATPKLKQVWLCHLSHDNNHPELARKTVEMTLNSYGIVPGKDFLLEVLKRKSPTGIFELKSSDDV